MARSKRRTVKVVLLAALLASAGAGTYYVTTQDGAWPARLFKQGELVAADAPATAPLKLNQSELDAVANAWASAEPMRALPHDDAGTMNTAYADANPQNEAGDDRYGLSGSTDPDSDSTNYRGASATPVVLPTAAEQDVTRGQEPNGYGAAGDEEASAAAPRQEKLSRRSNRAGGPARLLATTWLRQDRQRQLVIATPRLPCPRMCQPTRPTPAK